VPPTITHPDEIDRDFDGIEDALQARTAALTARELEERVRVIVTLKEHHVDADLDLFTAMDGEIRHTFEYVTYGFSGSMPVSKIGDLAEALGTRLNCIEEVRPSQACLDISTQIIGARNLVWETYGYRGDPDWAIAVLDSGIDDSHPDLSGYQNAAGGWPAPGMKVVGWEDIIGTSTGPVDYVGHGTHVASIAAGTGAALGSDPITGITTTFSGLLPRARIAGLDRIELPYSGSIVLDMAWAGSGNAFLGCYDSFGAWMGGWWSGTMPFIVPYTAIIPGIYTPVVGNYNSPSLEGQPFSALETYPYDDVGDGNNLFTGVAPESRLVGVRIYPGNTDDVIAGYDWVVANKGTYRIKVASSSIGFSGEEIISVRNAANNLVENGIVFVVSAGNDYPTPTIGDPGLASKVITVGATNDNDGMTDYSSNGAPGSGKPDVVAPGGSNQAGSKITAVDTNDCDGETNTFADRNPDDYTNMNGTSMSQPHVAGVAALVIQAMEDTGQPWAWTESEALKVKSIILMTACETNDSVHPGESTNDPSLDRGGRDLVEGYGRVCADAAIEAATMNYSIGTVERVTLGENPTDKRVWARQVPLSGGQQYDFSLSVPAGCDFDLYLYSGSVGPNGNPVILAGSTGNTLGEDESISYTPPSSVSHYLVVKCVAGSGEFSLDSTTLNTPPEVSNVVAAQGVGTGVINISYDVDDAEQSSVDVSLQYWDSNGSWHDCATTIGDGTTSTGMGKIGTWDAKTDFDGQYRADCKIRVIADDGRPADNIGQGDSAPFALDTKAPTGYGCDIPDDEATDVPVDTTLTAIPGTDDSPPILYKFMLAEDSGFTQGVQQSGWQSGVSWPPSTLANATDYWWKVQAKDSFENEGSWCTVRKFTTEKVPPTVTTDEATDITTNSATLNSSLDSLGDYSSVDVLFEWGTSPGVYTDETTPQEMTSTGPFSDGIDGLSSNTTYYFRIKATGSITVYGDELSFTTLISYDIPLGSGWNLVSVPLILDSASIEDILADMMNNVDSVWAYDNTTDRWAFYAPGEPSDLTEMTCDKGYWVRVTDPCTLTVEGREPTLPCDIPLGLDWNLIGLPLMAEPQVMEEILADIMNNVDSVWAYDNVTGRWAFYAPGEPSDLTEMTCDKGYWVRVDDPCTLTVQA